MSLSQLRLTEYQTSPGVTLSPAQRDALRTLAPSVTVVPSIGREHAYDLTPSSFVGIVQLPAQLELIIQPKLAIERVLFLISYAVGLGRWSDVPVEVARADSLLEALVPIFIRQLKRALGRGVLQGYRTEDDALATVRGRWRIGDQLRTRYGVMPPVEVSYDDFTEDIEPNRLLRAALRRLLRLRLRDDRSRWPLQALDARLDGVRLVAYDPRRLPVVNFDRRNEHYRAALGLARLIIAGLSFELEAGAVSASAFLIDMNRVFEDFVVTGLREALGVSERVLVQGAAGKRLFFDVAEKVALKPDISYWDGDRCLFVGDVKYKRILPAAYPNADLYQLTAYTIATALPSGMLIYAAGEAGSQMHEVRHLGKSLVLAPLDLTAVPALLLDQVAALAAEVKQVSTEAGYGPRRDNWMSAAAEGY